MSAKDNSDYLRDLLEKKNELKKTMEKDYPGLW